MFWSLAIYIHKGRVKENLGFNFFFAQISASVHQIFNILVPTQYNEGVGVYKVGLAKEF